SKVIERVAERVERGEHVGPRRGQAIHIAPFANDAVIVLPGLDPIDPFEAGPVPIDPLMSIEEFLIPAGFHPKTHGVERCHAASPLPLDGDAVCTPAQLPGKAAEAVHPMKMETKIKLPMNPIVNS